MLAVACEVLSSSSENFVQRTPTLHALFLSCQLTLCRHLAVLGALLTVLTVAIDSFIQQSVLYSSKFVISDPQGASVSFVPFWADTGKDAI